MTKKPINTTGALAHLFTDKKEHINLQLVEAGLAQVSIYPPNLLYVNELGRRRKPRRASQTWIMATPRICGNTGQ